MEAIMCTVSEKAERKKHLQTDGRTDGRTNIRTKRHMMKIIIDDFHHNKRYSIRDRHDENLGNQGEKNSYQIIQLDLLYNQYCKIDTKMLGMY